MIEIFKQLYEKKEPNRAACLIISGYIENIPEFFRDIACFDFVICADRGFSYARRLGIVPDLVIGDFDSLSPDFQKDIPSSTEVLLHPVEKDYTDTMLCLQYGVEHDFDEIVILGGMGGRLDHSLSNIQSMLWVVSRWEAQGDWYKKISMIDGRSYITLIKNGKISLSAPIGTVISIVSLSEVSEGVNTRGLKWQLEDASMSSSLPIGISNEFSDEVCEISVDNGCLLIAICRD